MARPKVSNGSVQKLCNVWQELEQLYPKHDQTSEHAIRTPIHVKHYLFLFIYIYSYFSILLNSRFTYNFIYLYIYLYCDIFRMFLCYVVLHRTEVHLQIHYKLSLQ